MKSEEIYHMNQTRTAYIAIVGRPNVGKSTLLNTLMGEKIAIVSNKPQTTRNRILGILTEGRDQYVFLDTPGIFTPRNALGEFMVRTADASVGDSDAVILMVDAAGKISAVEEKIIENIKRTGIPLTRTCRCAPKTARTPAHCSPNAKSSSWTPNGCSPRI